MIDKAREKKLSDMATKMMKLDKHSLIILNVLEDGLLARQELEKANNGKEELELQEA